MTQQVFHLDEFKKDITPACSCFEQTSASRGELSFICEPQGDSWIYCCSARRHIVLLLCSDWYAVKVQHWFVSDVHVSFWILFNLPPQKNVRHLEFHTSWECRSQRIQDNRKLFHSTVSKAHSKLGVSTGLYNVDKTKPVAAYYPLTHSNKPPK